MPVNGRTVICAVVFFVLQEIPLVKRKFYKGSSKARGSGIGLAVCDEIINLHKGTLEISSVFGEGTEVNITLPTLPVNLYERKDS